MSIWIWVAIIVVVYYVMTRRLRASAPKFPSAADREEKIIHRETAVESGGKQPHAEIIVDETVDEKKCA